MPDTDKQFTGSIPDIYDGYLVPLIFEPFAEDLARRIAAFAPHDVLETASGTGAVTRALAHHLPTARITATDLNQPMLNRAAQHQPRGAVVHRQQADAQVLPFAGASFDAVVCQFGVMFFPDKAKAHSEARRVLRPGGRYIFNVWDSLPTSEFTAVISQALDKVFPANPIRFMERTPHGYFEEDRIRADLVAAGFTAITIEPVDHISHAKSANDVAIAFCQGTPIRNEIEARSASRLNEATAYAAEALTRRFGSGEIEGRIRALVVTSGG